MKAYLTAFDGRMKSKVMDVRDDAYDIHMMFDNFNSITNWQSHAHPTHIQDHVRTARFAKTGKYIVKTRKNGFKYAIYEFELKDIS